MAAVDAKKPPVRDERLTPEELRTLLRLARKALRADDDMRRALQAQRVNIVPANFYSDIPTVEDIENSFEFRHADGPYNSPSVFDPAAMRAYLAELDRYADEFDPPVDGDVEAPQGYFWRNPAFAFSDAMAYYCVLRHTRPRHLVEVGAGFSTLVALRALERNGGGAITVVEPYPMPWLARRAGDIELVAQPVQTLEAGFFNDRLRHGDVLFIDSTHTVKAGSDCLHLYLRVLPNLQADLTVHAHDIYLPFPLPRSQFARHIYWTEQYLLYAYLLDNPRARVLYGSNYHSHFEKALLARFMRGRWPAGGASLWFSLAGRCP